MLSVQSESNKISDRWYKKFQEYSGVNMEEIQNKLKIAGKGETEHPDSKLILWVAGELKSLIPTRATDFGPKTQTPTTIWS